MISLSASVTRALNSLQIIYSPYLPLLGKASSASVIAFA